MYKTMNNQDIITKPPKGSTHTETLASTKVYYLKKDTSGMGYFVYLDGEWTTSMAVTGFIRSLSDIKRIVELEKELSSLVRGIKDLGSISYDQFPDTKTAENILKEHKP
jgi:hypothetical protein